MSLDVSHPILQTPLAKTEPRTIDTPADRPHSVVSVVAAHDEAERIGETLAALAGAWPGAPVWVADDGSRDQTARTAREAGAQVVASGRVIGKGGAVTAAARAALEHAGGCSADTVFVLCDGDLGGSARELPRLAALVSDGRADLAVAAFATPVGGGFGVALGFARWAIHRRCGLNTRAPISGQRALSMGVLRDVLPFADGYGMEVAMTIDAVRRGYRVVEVELELSHRPTGRTPAGFLHRARQLVDIMRAYRARS